ncbi:MAG: glycosyltransferase [Actinobacteria bacterium]|jgi:tetratricopeptide (TPR) repeat protein|nr:glycosyltransferase [Actinomycetota bacterium]MCL6094602.1 glycosyltransferase [Actinomycetota bacterium]
MYQVDSYLERLARTKEVAKQRQLVVALVQRFLQLGLGREAIKWISRLREMSNEQITADLLYCWALVTSLHFEEALEFMEELPENALDDEGFSYDPKLLLACSRAKALVEVGRYSEAADALIERFDREGAFDCLELALESLDNSNRSYEEVVNLIPWSKQKTILSQVLHMQPERGDRFLEACFNTFPNRLTVLAAAAKLASRLPLQRTFTWSIRLHGEGFYNESPLLAKAGNPSTKTSERTMAALLASTALGDLRSMTALQSLYPSMNREKQKALKKELRTLVDQLGIGEAALSRTTLGHDRAAPNHDHRVPSGISPYPVEPDYLSASKTTVEAMNGANPSVEYELEEVRISFVLVSRNQAPSLLGSLESLANVLPSELDFEVLIVDDASNDATQYLLDNLSGDVLAIRNRYPLGTPAAIVTAVVLALGQWLCFVDPGWRFTKKQLEALARRTTHWEEGIILPERATGARSPRPVPDEPGPSFLAVAGKELTSITDSILEELQTLLSRLPSPENTALFNSFASNAPATSTLMNFMDAYSKAEVIEDD